MKKLEDHLLAKLPESFNISVDFEKGELFERIVFQSNTTGEVKKGFLGFEKVVKRKSISVIGYYDKYSLMQDQYCTSIALIHADGADDLYYFLCRYIYVIIDKIFEALKEQEEAKVREEKRIAICEANINTAIDERMDW